MNLLREYIRKTLLEIKSSELPWGELSDSLRAKFPNFGETVVSLSGQETLPFTLEKRTISDRSGQRLASFLVGYGEYDSKNPVTKITNDELDSVIEEINKWSSQFGLHVARDQLATNGNRAFLKVGLMDLATDEVKKPEKLYHVTDPDTAELILSQGLVPRSAKRRGKGGRAGDMMASAGRSYPERIFMFTTKGPAISQALKTAKIMHRMSFTRDVLGDIEAYNTEKSQSIGRSETPVVLEIEGSKVGKIMSDPDFAMGSGAVFTTEAIPPEAITKLSTLDREDYVYNWKENYKVEQMLKDDYEGTMAKIKKWESSQGL